MGAIQDIFQQFGPEYVQRFGACIPGDHLKAIEAIIGCRTDACGMTVYECTDCGKKHHIFRSCGDRHCPGCQCRKGFEWLHRQMERQVPGHHFMVTFTVPEALRRFIRGHQRAAFSALFSASSETMRKLAKDERHIGGDTPGFFGVLHTWGRQLHYHPHIHYVVAGGAFDQTQNRWCPSRSGFFLPVKAMSRIYRAKFREAMIREGLYSQIPAEVWDMDWNVNVQAVDSAEQTLKYLAPYVFKVAISDHRIASVEDRTVTIRYRKSGGNRTRTMALDVMEFMRRFLQHVLPTGFMKVRYFGFMNPNSAVSLEEVRGLIELSLEFEVLTPDPEIKPIKPLYCSDCGGTLRYRHSILPNQMTPPTRVFSPGRPHSSEPIPI